MSYICVAEEEGGEPIELPTEEDGTGGRDGAFGEHNSSSKSYRLILWTGGFIPVVGFIGGDVLVLYSSYMFRMWTNCTIYS